MSSFVGVARLIQAAEDSDRYGQTFIQNLVGSAVPTGLAQEAHLEDPVVRQAHTVLDAVRSRLPWYTEELPPRRDIFGQPITRNPVLGHQYGLDRLNTIAMSKVSNDPVAQEMLRLKEWPGPVEQKLRGITLTPDQYDDYQRVAGRLMHNALSSYVRSDWWGVMPDFAQKEMMHEAVNQTRKTAAGYMLMLHPDLIQTATDAKVKQITGAK
jgi:hypothetical protein